MQNQAINNTLSYFIDIFIFRDFFSKQLHFQWRTSFVLRRVYSIFSRFDNNKMRAKIQFYQHRRKA